MWTNAKIVGKNVNPVDYFATPQDTKRGHGDWPMSSSSLRAFGQCPSRWLRGYEPPDSKAKEFGRLLDCMVLTPDQFTKRYAIQPAEYESDEGVKKWSNNAKVCRSWNALRRAEGKEIVTASEVEECGKAAASLRSDDILNAFLAVSDCQVWLTADWEDKDTGIVVPCRCLVDCIPGVDSEFGKSMGDLKTTRNAFPAAWQRWCFSAGYHIQAAFNLDMYIAATSEDRVTWCFLVLENYHPWEPDRKMLSQDLLERGRATYQRLLGNYAQCLKHGRWPGYSDNDESVQGWTIVYAEPYMDAAEAFAPHYKFGEEEEQQPEEEPTDLIP